MAWKFFTAQGAEKLAPASAVTPMCKITLAGAQSPGNSVQTNVLLDTVEYDTDGMANVANNRIVIQHAGKYLITSQVEFANNTTGQRFSAIAINGTAKEFVTTNATSGTISTDVSGSYLANLNVGDVVTLQCFQTSGGGLALSNLSFLAATKVDGAVVTYVGVPGATLVGQELAYQEYTSSVSSSTATQAAPLDVVSAGAVTFDGVTPIWIEFFCPSIISGGSSTAGLSLWDGTDLGVIQEDSGSTIANTGGTYKRRLTPSAGSHTFKVRLWTTASNNYVASAGVGGPGNFVPGFIRITRAA